MGRYWRGLVAVLVGVALLVGGCTAAAHLGVLQPSSVPSFLPRSASLPQSPSLPPGLPALPPTTAFQRGIDVDFYTYPGQDVAAAAAVTVGYVRSLHANAIAISFPFFMTSRYAAGVHAGAATPTPGQLTTVIIAARRAGMRVTLRPLLDEKVLGGSRADLRPVNEVQVTFGPVPGADVQIKVGNSDPRSATAVSAMTTVARADDVGGTHAFAVRGRASGRYVLIWFTRLPPEAGAPGKYRRRSSTSSCEPN
jgi:hypothetical protein